MLMSDGAGRSALLTGVHSMCSLPVEKEMAWAVIKTRKLRFEVKGNVKGTLLVLQGVAVWRLQSLTCHAVVELEKGVHVTHTCEPEGC
jgi:hypothetical protein